MALENDDLALLSARFGVARFGASRFGFCPDDVEGTGTDEPGEYIWKEDKPPTTVWELQSLYSFCGEPPVALFSSDSCGVVDVAIEFTDASTPADVITYWYWSFGDGEESYEQNPSHAFAAPGAYTVRLYVSSATGSATYSKDISVMTLSVAADDEAPDAGVDVTFIPTIAGGFDPYSYFWDFGVALPALEATGLFGYWDLDEVEGNDRVCSSGSGPDLVESGGTIGDAIGLFSNAVESDIADTAALGATIAPALALASGLTVAFWFKWPEWPSIKPGSMLSIDNGRALAPRIEISRYYGSDFLSVYLVWNSGSIALPLPRLGGFDSGEWHLFVLTYDPSDGMMTGRVDDGCRSSATIWTGVPLPAEKLQKIVPSGSLAEVNAVTFSRIELLKAISGNYVNFEGQIDDLRIWTEVLTDAQIAKLWRFSDEESPVYAYYEGGTYDATLVVTDANGCEKTDSVEIVVTAYEAPVASFDYVSYPEQADVSFTDTSTGEIESWAWEFGNPAAGTSDEQNPYYIYPEGFASGPYTVTLTVTGPGGSDEATASLSPGVDLSGSGS